MRRLLLSLVALLWLSPLFAGCQQQDRTEPSPQPPPAARRLSLLQEPIEPPLLELPGEAIPLWRQTRALKPALVLLSSDPLMSPLPKEMEARVLRLVASGENTDWRQLTLPQSPDPLLLPPMTVTAALRAGFFSQVLWAFPSDRKENELSVQSFAAQLSDYGALTTDEAAKIDFNHGIFSGTILGVPFRAAPLRLLPAPPGPAVVHLDTGYFQPLYKGEIKTPLFALLHDTLVELRDKRIQVETLTISRSNLDGSLPLEVRFIADALAWTFANPAILDQDPPDNWKRRANALYLANFFQKEKIRELYLAMEQNEPQDPSIKFALYQNARLFKDGNSALAYLERAVTLDPVYALEYLSLAKYAAEDSNLDGAMKMLQKAATSMPGNPFIPLEQATLLLKGDRRAAATPLLEGLEGLPWSPVYHPGIPATLKEMKESAREGGGS